MAERPQAISTDGRRRPIVDLNGRPIPAVPPGAVAFGSRSDSQTLEIGAEVDGRVLSASTYKVSADGKTLTATNEGVGLRAGTRTSGFSNGLFRIRTFRKSKRASQNWPHSAQNPQNLKRFSISAELGG